MKTTHAKDGVGGEHPEYYTPFKERLCKRLFCGTKIDHGERDYVCNECGARRPKHWDIVQQCPKHGGHPDGVRSFSSQCPEFRSGSSTREILLARMEMGSESRKLEAGRQEEKLLEGFHLAEEKALAAEKQCASL
ncbi:hypothetical protein PCANC_06425 [Puccinia coronata f. sp. avenae]|uniref:Uncharacterized protein n=1 Tax=Puccinia coronata f. sp. avenae TaxID=200324 RepID=A0A2N5VVU9_9BASI|nr:hypothetical protein PCANC_06425 [Puccinia coronata f. sp. avenae]